MAQKIPGRIFCRPATPGEDLIAEARQARGEQEEETGAHYCDPPEQPEKEEALQT